MSLEDLVYTDDIGKIMNIFKHKLPTDFPLVTRIEVTDTENEGEYFYIVLCVEQHTFGWRTVEDRLSIAVTLEELRTAIEGTGIRCVIEKDWSI